MDNFSKTGQILKQNLDVLILTVQQWGKKHNVIISPPTKKNHLAEPDTSYLQSTPPLLTQRLYNHQAVNNFVNNLQKHPNRPDFNALHTLLTLINKASYNFFSLQIHNLEQLNLSYNLFYLTIYHIIFNKLDILKTLLQRLQTLWEYYIVKIEVAPQTLSAYHFGNMHQILLDFFTQKYPQCLGVTIAGNPELLSGFRIFFDGKLQDFSALKKLKIFLNKVSNFQSLF